MPYCRFFTILLHVVIHIWYYLQDLAKECFITTYSPKLIEIYSHVATGLQEKIRLTARENNVEEMYNIEIIPLTDELPKIKAVEPYYGSFIKAVSGP